MNLHDALFHWLQMKKVAEARPNDRAALDTMQFFTDVLLEDHQLAHFELFEQDEEFYYVSFRKMEEEEHSVKRFKRQRPYCDRPEALSVAQSLNPTARMP